MGDALFAAQLGALLLVLGRRFVTRGELPPPNFVLVACGLLSGLVGASAVVFASISGQWPRLYQFGSLALRQGLVLMPVLGVGVFLFPRFLGGSFDVEIKDLRQPTPWWRRRAGYAAAAGLGIFASFALESTGSVREGSALRFAVVATYITTQIPAVLRFGAAPPLGQWIRVTNWLLLLGLLSPALAPTYRVTGLHSLFIGGFMLTVFVVATRVMLGHSGQLELCKKRLPFLTATAVLLLLGLATRIGADFLPTFRGRSVHLVYAALLCIASALVWGIRLVPRVLIPDSEE